MENLRGLGAGTLRWVIHSTTLGKHYSHMNSFILPYGPPSGPGSHIPALMFAIFFCSGQGKCSLVSWVPETDAQICVCLWALLLWESSSHVQPPSGRPQRTWDIPYNSTLALFLGNSTNFPQHWTMIYLCPTLSTHITVLVYYHY